MYSDYIRIYVSKSRFFRSGKQGDAAGIPINANGLWLKKENTAGFLPDPVSSKGRKGNNLKVENKYKYTDKLRVNDRGA